MASPAPSLALPQQSSALNVSPRRDPLTRLGALTVTYAPSARIRGSNPQYCVNCNFIDGEQQNRVFAQLLNLENAGVHKMDFSLRLLNVEFVFVDLQKSAQFAERIRGIADQIKAQGGSTASSDITPRHNPSPTPEYLPSLPFSRWGEVTVALSSQKNSELDSTDFLVKVTFSHFEKQQLVKRELSQLSEAGVINFMYSLKEPVVTFTFYNEGKAQSFMQHFVGVDAPPKTRNGSDDDDLKQT